MAVPCGILQVDGEMVSDDDKAVQSAIAAAKKKGLAIR
jgi:hypothetical protein